MPPTDYSFRVRGIPAGTTREKLQTLVAEAVSCQDASGVRVRSLASNASRPREMVATVTFASIPENLSDECGDWTVEAQDITLVIDTHFHGCTTLYYPPADQWKSDLIAVSGLNGHAFGSFKKKNGSYMWLRDSLPVDFPGCRIIIYGYDTKLQDSNSFQSILDIGKKFQTAVIQVRQNTRKPLTLLGHSLGGIVVKEAIGLMRRSSIHADKLAYEAIIGLILFGVPNQGMDIQSLIPMVGDRANRGFLHTLDHNSPVLRNLAREFPLAMRDLRFGVLNFYETEVSPTALQDGDGKWSMSGPPAVLVDVSSATNGRPEDSRYHRVSPIDCDHSNLIKFGSAYDEPYVTVTAFLQEIHIHGASRRVPMTKTEEACYQSLGFREQYHRMDSLEPSPGTCDWLTAHELFTEWLESSKGFLWIRGKPGSGKSMAMKHALNHIKNSTSGIVASFFIHGQGTELQKTILGIYRSLLHQIYPYSPEHFSGLTKRFQEYTREAGMDKQDVKWSWMLGEIRQSFLEDLQRLCRKDRIIILVDALDESGEDQARAIFKDFETLIGSLRDDSMCRLSLCVSCRHYPELDFNGGKTIVVENLNRLDIEHVVNSILDTEHKFDESEKRQLRTYILTRSEGIFQWTSLVTETIKRARQRGVSFRAAMRNADRVPMGLDILYKALLEPEDEQEHELKQRIKLFQWVLLATKPLTPQILRHAMALDSKMTYKSVHEYEKSDEFATEQDFETKIKNLSRGLMQINGSFQDGRVEFIHQSVPEFLINHGGLELLSGLICPDAMRLGHLELSMSCLRYLLAEEILHFPWEPSPQRILSREEQEKLIRRFPVISYAWRNWIYHAVSGKGPENNRIEELCGSDIMEIFCWPHDQRIIKLWTPLRHAFGSPLASWARQFGPSSSVSRGDIYKTPTLEWPCENARLIHLLAATGLLGKSTQRTMSSDLEIPDGDSFTPLAYAIFGQQKTVVQNMIASRVHVKYKTGRSRESPLHLASRWGDPTVVSLLLKSGSKVGSTGLNSWTPLHTAACAGNVEAINILIDAGAKVNHQSKASRSGRYLLHFQDGRSPLNLAISYGNTEAVRHLICRGADVNLKCLRNKEPPLIVAVKTGCIDTVKLLLERGADTKTRDSFGNSALHHALLTSRLVGPARLNVVELLIQFDCEVNARNKVGKTPLHMATNQNTVEIFNLLISRGADPN